MEGAADSVGAAEEAAAEEAAAVEEAAEEAALLATEAWNSLATARKDWMAASALLLGQIEFRQLSTSAPRLSATHLMSAMLLEQAPLDLET